MHNWSATKQRLRPQSVSVAEISRHSVSSGDRIWQCGTSSGSRHKDTDQCKSVRKRLSRDHCCRGRSKPGCRIVGSHTRWELTTSPDFQLCLHRLLMSAGCKSSHNGFLDVSRSIGGLRISGWIGQLSCLTIFSTSLSVAAFLRRVRSSMIFPWDMAIYRFSKWRPSAILELFYHCTRPPRKSLLLAAAACQISCQSDTHLMIYM